MGLQPVGPRWLRRLRRLTGQDVVHASTGGGYSVEFTTADHRHGWLNMRVWKYGRPTGPLWELDPPDYCPHYTSCARLFPTTGDDDAT